MVWRRNARSRRARDVAPGRDGRRRTTPYPHAKASLDPPDHALLRGLPGHRPARQMRTHRAPTPRRPTCGRAAVPWPALTHVAAASPPHAANVLPTQRLGAQEFHTTASRPDIKAQPSFLA
jgi:hypothetical protein